MAVKTGVYARISQDRDGTRLGVERQVADCKKVAADRGWVVADTYVDNDVSASTGRKRPEYTRLCEDISGGRIQAVVVWDLDRLHRRPVELEAFIDLADRYAIKLASVSGSVDLSTSDGRLHARIKGAVARQEVEHKSDRQVRAMRQLAERGQWSGGTRGFGIAADGLTVIDSEAEEIRGAIAQVITGASLGEIVRDLNCREILTTTGRKWSITPLRQLLVQARIAGLRSYRGEIIGPAAWPAIIDEDTWRAARTVLTDPGRRRSTTNARRWLLSGIARCGVCGDVMRSASVTTRKGEHRPVYRCKGRVESGASGPRHPMRACEPVDALVERVVIARLSQPDAISLLEVDEPTASRRQLLRDAEALRVRRQQLEDDHYIAGTVTRAAFTRLEAGLARRAKQLDAELAATSRVRSLAGLAGARDVEVRWANLTLSRRRAVVDALVEIRVLPGLRGKVFDPELIEIKWTTP